jgi:hypothetical protein
MKTETKNFEAETVENRKLPDNYRLITGYPSDNSHSKSDPNTFTTNNKEVMTTDNSQKSSVAPIQSAGGPLPVVPPLNLTLNPNLNLPSRAQAVATPPQTDPLDFMRKLIPASLRKRKFRADSFTAKLTLPQRALVISWLQQETAEAVRAKVAAPAPAGFGIEVHTSALYRLRNLISNTELNHWIENAMDATFDILEADTSVDTAPMREALSLLLHSRIMTFVREQTNPVSIDRLLSALTRLEKLKTHIAQRAHLITAPREKTTRHKVEVQITTNPGSPAPITVHATHQSLPGQSPQEQIACSGEGDEK